MDSYSQSSISVLSSNRVDARSAIQKASSETGANFNYLLKTAQRESGMDPNAKAATSSATGLFQFTDDTWLRMVDRYGEKYGLKQEAGAIQVDGRNVDVASRQERSDILALRKDPMIAARMAGELANENATILRNKIGRNPSEKELYIAHFMGPSGAANLINAVKSGSNEKAADLFPAAARANPAIFNEKSGQARSVSAVYAELTKTKHQPAPSSNSSVGVVSEVNKFVQDMPMAPTGTLKMGMHLSSGMVMTLLDLQQRHLENADEQREEAKTNTKTSLT